MENLTKEQEKARDEFFAKRIASSETTKEAVARIMNDPEKRRIFNALVAATTK